MGKPGKGVLTVVVTILYDGITVSTCSRHRGFSRPPLQGSARETIHRPRPLAWAVLGRPVGASSQIRTLPYGGKGDWEESVKKDRKRILFGLSRLVIY